uniref:Uncharacterized protein n=1 Tax=Chenopodium quinoa TaxID=63459 RepID=A0A803M294_CHEQI
MEIGDDEEKINLVKSLCDAYGAGPKKETISLKAAFVVLYPLDSENKPLPLVTKYDEEELMIAFLIVVLGKLLCTMTNYFNLAASLTPSLTVATEASEYDWCTFIIEWLCDTAHRFQEKFLRDGFRSGCGGSFLFVMIFYLVHLHRKLVEWGVFPRVKVWNSLEIRAALMDDKLTRDKYGKLLTCLVYALDKAYGEEHSLVLRDVDCFGRTVSIVTQP